MKVAYDTSILGQGYINPKAKTGIHRVVESLFLELIRFQNIELSLIALHNYSSSWDYQSMKLYLQSQHPQLLNKLEPCYKSQFDLNKLYNNAIQIQQRLIDLSLNNYPIFYKSALLWGMAFKQLAKFNDKIKLNKNQFQIYHSLFILYQKLIFQEY